MTDFDPAAPEFQALLKELRANNLWWAVQDAKSGNIIIHSGTKHRLGYEIWREACGPLEAKVSSFSVGGLSDMQNGYGDTVTTALQNAFDLWLLSKLDVVVNNL